jgi:hypothetical protein
MAALAPAASLLPKRAVLKSGAPRLIDRRGERLRGAIAIGAANRPPSAKRVGARLWPTPHLGRRCIPTLLKGLRTGSSRLTTTRAGSSGRASMSQGSQRIGFTSTVLGELDRLPAGSNAGSGSSRGVWPPPITKGPRSRGAVPEPFAPFPWGALLPLERHSCRSPREARPGCVSPRRASRQCGAGERGAPPSGRGRG